jgi:hypothetical protein
VLDITTLATFVPGTQQEDHRLATLGVIDSVARSVVNAQLPNTVTTKFVITEVSQLDSIDTAQDLDLGFCISQLFEPILKRVSAALSQVVANFKHSNFRL